MKLEKFVGSILPNFERSRILEEVKSIQDELKKNTLKPYKEANELFGKLKFKGKFTEEMNELCDRRVRGFKKNYINTVYIALQNIDDRMVMIEELVEKEFGNEVMRDGLTYLKANLLQYLSVLGFVVRYSRRLLITTYVLESSAISHEAIDKGASRDLQWLQKNRYDFVQALNIALQKEKDIEKAFEKTPAMVIDAENISEVEATAGVDKTDPLAMGLISANWNPIFHLRMTYTKWRADHYRVAQEELRTLEFRLLHLKNLQAGKKDPKVEKEVDYYTNRVEKLRYNLKEYEDESGQ